MSQVPMQQLRDYLAQVAPRREKTIAAASGVLGLAFAAIIVALYWGGEPATLPPAVPLAAAFTATLGMFKLAQYAALRRGWWRPEIRWVNVVVEIGWVLALAFVIGWPGDVAAELISPTFALLFVSITVSGLRASRSMALLSGGLAATGYLVLYFAFGASNEAVAAPLDSKSITLALLVSPQLMVVRAVALAAAGALNALVAQWFVHSAEDALKVSRERDVFGKYLLHERIGAGGMAEVYRATYCPEGGFEKSVAVKRILPAYVENADFLTMFREEARLGALLVHPNIVQVLDFGTHRGTYFLSMEFVDGISLSRLLRKLAAPLSARAATYIAAEIAAAMQYIHTRKDASGEPLRLVHRDLNPPNILLSRSGDVKLADFGIARAGDRVRVTDPGYVRGKPGYMAPEQERAEVLDARTDLFALGATLYETLTGVAAFPTVGPEATTMVGRVSATPIAASIARADVPAEVDAIITALLQPEPGARIQTGEALRSQLMVLPGTAKPYPCGQQDLARCVAEVMDEYRREAEAQATKAC